MGTIVGSGNTQYVSGGSIISDTQVEPGGEQVVESGGTANDTSVFGVDVEVAGANESIIGLQVVDFGGIAAGAYVSNGEQDVYGLAITTSLTGGSKENVLAGALAEYGTLQESTQTIVSGGESYQDSLWGTTQNVSGVAKQDTLLFDTSEYVAAGGSALGSIVSEGNVFVESGGLLSGADVIEGNNGQAIIVSAGGSALATTLSAFDQRVSSGGYVSGTQILSGASQYNDGYEDGTSIQSGADDSIGADGYAQYTVVAGSQTVEGQSYAATVSRGGLMEVLSSTFDSSHWAFATEAAVYGVEKLDAGGEDYFSYIYGSQAVSSGAEASGSILVGGYEEVQSGGFASEVAAYDVGEQYIEAGGSAASSFIGSGSYLLVGGSAAAVTADGTITLVSGGAITGITLSADGRTNILGGVESNGTIDGGYEYVYSGGDSQDATLSGGYQDIEGGQTEQTDVMSGGVQYVSSGGVANYSLVYQGGRMVIRAHGLTALTEIGSGGALFISNTGSAEESFDDAGATVTVLSGGRESDGQIDGRISAGSGAVILHDTVDSGGTEIDFGRASRTIVLSGGKAVVSAGGVLNAAIVSSGGEAEVASGGVASGTTVRGGGYEYVLASGVTTGTVLSSGGREVVFSGATASGTIVRAGGLGYVYAGGAASNLALVSGGIVIDNGRLRNAGAGTLAGTLSGGGDILETSGRLLVSGKGAGFGGRALVEGGAIELATSGALGSGLVQFEAPASGSAVLQIDAADAPAAGGTFANKIADFSGANEDIDLRSIAYVSGASATVHGSRLVLTDGGKIYTFNLGGSMAGRYAVLSDGHGGTLIDPGAVAFVQAVAAFAPADAGKTALVSSTEPAATPFAHTTASAGAAPR